MVNLDQYDQCGVVVTGEWLTAEEAMARLGVRPQTLYAYVSRGRVEAQPDPDDPRRSRYRLADIAELATRKGRGRKAADVAQGAIAWGEPVLASAITTIAHGRLFYRGRDAAELAQTASLESVARLLRGGHGAALKAVERASVPDRPTMRARMFAALAQRAGADPPARGRAPLALAVEAASLLDGMADAVAGEVGDGPIHERLASAWACDPDLIRRTLVLLADHELNASTFAARVAVSTGASLAAGTLAGLAALGGPRHGGAASAVAILADDIGNQGDAEAALRHWLGEGRGVPGFGHPLYPDGDPRAAALIECLELSGVEAKTVAAAQEAAGLSPNIDFALASLRRALRLPPGSGLVLFAMARRVGWIAHALEQNAEKKLIRPRAEYVGIRPE
jgi:citrate synthase